MNGVYFWTKESKWDERIQLQQGIFKMYEQLCLDQNDILHRTKLLLSVYRDVVWITLNKSANLTDELIYYGDDLNGALIYLEQFSPEIERQEFERRISMLFENKWMVDLIDMAMGKIYDYPNNGNLYHEILSKATLPLFVIPKESCLNS